MSDTFEEFKLIFTIMMVDKIVNTGTPPAKNWPVPKEFIENQNILSALISPLGLKLYLEMSEDEQKEAISFVENCGPSLAELVECPLFEDWDEEKLVFTNAEVHAIRQKLVSDEELNEVYEQFKD